MLIVRFNSCSSTDRYAPLAGHRKSELGASRVLFPWNVFAFHRLYAPSSSGAFPRKDTSRITHPTFPMAC
ncbi:MAG: hypothetical protein KTR25_07830 [Myxococcales bacterium]|nr:hypothetical protein [Myxococcales bacterium]